MIEVVIDSIRVSLMAQYRIVVLREADTERYLTIWIGPSEADAITVKLQGIEVSRPLTHDLIQNLLSELGTQLLFVYIRELRNDVYHASLVIEVNRQRVEVDARPSDAIAIAVRTQCPIYVSDEVMRVAGTLPDAEVALESATPENKALEAADSAGDLSPFAEFMDSLDLGDLPASDEDDQ